jgi:hypothetical protein
MKRILCSLLVATLPLGSVLAEAPQSKDAKVTLVYQHELPNVPGKSIKGVLVEYGPGGYSPGHMHPKSAFIYATVLGGAIRSQVNDGPVTTYKAGRITSTISRPKPIPTSSPVSWPRPGTRCRRRDTKRHSSSRCRRRSLRSSSRASPFSAETAKPTKLKFTASARGPRMHDAFVSPRFPPSCGELFSAMSLDRLNCLLFSVCYRLRNA